MEGTYNFIDYKNMQRSFVSNLNGTTTAEIVLVTSFLPLSVILRTLLLYTASGHCRQSGKLLRSRLTILMEYFTLVLPPLLVFTIMADYAFMVLVLSIAVVPPIISNTVLVSNVRFSDPPNPWFKRTFLRNFRAYVNISTAIGILAVDFVVFPRRFAKTETFGTGLMDIAVGCFMISNAIVCREARGLPSVSVPFFEALKKEVKSVSLLLCLGLARFLAVKSTDYQEHVSEYGVHWNFFLTLASVRISSTIIVGIVPRFLRNHLWILGFFIGLFYQYALNNGLEHFILHGLVGDGSRTNFIDANREGICSSFGYLSLYFIGIRIGKLIFQTKQENVRCALKLLLSLVLVVVLAWSILHYWITHVGLISRRLANFAFVLWQIAFNVQLLAMFLIVDILMISSGSKNILLLTPGGCGSCFTKNDKRLTKQDTRPSHEVPHAQSTSPGVAKTVEDESCSHTGSLNEAGVPMSNGECQCLLSAVDFNQLGYFLTANLLTGLVNLSFETIKASPFTAFLILNIYLFTLNTIIIVLYRYKLLLKL